MILGFAGFLTVLVLGATGTIIPVFARIPFPVWLAIWLILGLVYDRQFKNRRRKYILLYWADL